MKFGADADIDEYKKAVKFGVAKGVGIGALCSLGVTAFLKRRTSYFANAGGFQKVLIWAAPSAFMGITFAESASRSFEDHKRRQQHGLADETAPHPSASQWDRTTEWIGDNKYKLITGGWAASMAGSFYLVNRDKYMTKAQKIVQARVYAQGLTVLMLLLSVVLSVSPPNDATAEKRKKEIASHSWERDISFVESANRHPSALENGNK